MIPAALLGKEREFRRAVERRQYRELTPLLDQMRLIAQQHPGPEVAEWMQATIRWATIMVTVQRQNWADELGRLPLVSRYLERGQDSLPGICLDL
jgi:hypothetical protein